MSFFRKQGNSPDEAPAKNTQGLRINIFFFSTFVIFCVIIIRLAVLQFVEGPTLTEVETNREVKKVPLAALRGTIFSADGAKLAYSTPVQSLYITLTTEYTAKKTDKKTKKVDYTPEAKANVQKLAADLVAVFNKYGDKQDTPITEKDVIESLDMNYKKFNGYTPRRVKAGLNDKEVAYFLEHKNEFPGLEIVEENARHYDTDQTAVQAVGYVKLFKNSNSQNIYKNVLTAMKKVDADPGLSYKDDELVGFDGLELQYQRELRGKNGYQEVAVNPQNMAENIEGTVPPVKGNNVYSTINKSIQQKTQQAITDQIKWLHTNPVQGELHPNATTGYAVAMEVDTGNIVAMASMPDYDTNAWASGTMSTAVYKQIETYFQNGTITPNASGRSGHGFQSLVLLGSTIKPLSVLVGLNEGLITTSTVYNDTGITEFGKAGHETKVRNSSNHAYGSLYPRTAIEKSSNVFMVDEIAKKLYRKYNNDQDSLNVWDKYMKQFGLGVETGVDLPNESRGKIDYFDLKSAGSVQAAIVYASFGQQAKYTALQLAQYTATLANKGVRIKPNMVSKITDTNGNVVKTFGRTVLNTVEMKDSYWNEVKVGMNTKVDAFNGFPYDFARKTGTSQQEYWSKGHKQVIDNGVFIAYAPRENPKLAVAVIIPEGGFGSSSAAPVARKIFDAYDWEYGLDGVPKKTLQTSKAAAEGGEGAATAGTDAGGGTH
ncbi:penicillin-binding protein 2 [Paenibacillus spiritus]|uniref:Penicillin-binding protein 2 n=1 Tax=Paenibacillus spiritus TaxID=2496557 RepID=A0A5J5GK94_9BACL|nr:MULTISPECIES: penicillin-binding transpeptidase domain-containing protein [Paenibacillus]KAA9008625.1 penicillin-binding protein 2 [Paenibacillus spiritus]